MFSYEITSLQGQLTDNYLSTKSNKMINHWNRNCTSVFQIFMRNLTQLSLVLPHIDVFKGRYMLFHYIRVYNHP